MKQELHNMSKVYENEEAKNDILLIIINVFEQNVIYEELHKYIKKKNYHLKCVFSYLCWYRKYSKKRIL